MLKLYTFILTVLFTAHSALAQFNPQNLRTFAEPKILKRVGLPEAFGPAPQPAQPQANSFYPLLSHYMRWDTTNRAWGSDSISTSYRYGNDGTVTRLATYNFITGDSVELEEHLLNENGADTLATWAVWRSGAWRPISRYKLWYDARGNQILANNWYSYMGMQPLALTGVAEHTYDSLDRMLSQKVYSPDSSGVLQLQGKQVYTYSGTAPGPVEIVEDFYNAPTWFRHKYADFVYGSLSPTIPLSSRHYWYRDSAYVPDMQRTTTYVNDREYSNLEQRILLDSLGQDSLLINDNLSIRVIQGDSVMHQNHGSWYDGEWHSGNRTAHVWDSLGNLTYAVRQYYRDSPWGVSQGNKIRNFYNADGTLNRFICATWNNTTKQFVENSSQTKYFYYISLVAARPIVASSPLNAHPSPTSDKLNLDVNGAIACVQVYDAAGKAYSVSFKEDQVDVSSLKPGLYHIRAVGRDGRVQTGRFVKE